MHFLLKIPIVLYTEVVDEERKCYRFIKSVITDKYIMEVTLLTTEK